MSNEQTLIKEKGTNKRPSLSRAICIKRDLIAYGATANSEYEELSGEPMKNPRTFKVLRHN